ncbi:MAG TPA: helix-turn-helix transcriptional regulator [Gemmatimonadaceae bacterium]|nr:helix-turn-helix transcriptional regulator [Gemmatimonadaceae bacterium]
MTPATYHILLALAGKDRHGYLIRKAVEQQTGGALRLGPGTLYAAIRRLEDQGLIEESPWRPEADLDDQRRRYYRLTNTGRAALRTETVRMRDTVTFALKQLKPKLAR